MWLEHGKTRTESEDETVAPFSARHVRGLPSVFRRQLVVQRNDDGLLAREISIEESDADACFLRDIAQRRGFVSPRGDQSHRRRIQPFSCSGPLRRLARRSPPFPRFDIFSEHVHYY